MDKRILVFIDWYRPAYRAGGPVTSVANMVAHLLADHLGAKFRFFILTRNTDYGETTPYEGVEPDRWIETGPNVQVCYIPAEKMNCRHLRKRALEAECNTWFINGIYSWYFSILPLLLSKRLKPSSVIVSARGMLSPHARAVKACKKCIFVGLANLLNLYKGATFHATSTHEASDIQKAIGTRAAIRVAPNLPAVIHRERETTASKRKGSLSLLYLARISPEKNTFQGLEILSRIKTGKIDVQLVGQTGAREYWIKCNDLIERMPPNVRITYRGAVPPDHLAEIMRAAHFLFLPTTGENYGHAIIECMSMGLPVIISDRTPWTGLKEAGVGWDIPLDRESGFRDAILECLEMDQETYDTISRSAFQYAERVTGDPEILEMNQKLFSEPKTLSR